MKKGFEMLLRAWEEVKVHDVRTCAGRRRVLLQADSFTQLEVPLLG